VTPRFNDSWVSRMAEVATQCAFFNDFLRTARTHSNDCSLRHSFISRVDGAVVRAVDVRWWSTNWRCHRQTDLRRQRETAAACLQLIPLARVIYLFKHFAAHWSQRRLYVDWPMFSMFGQTASGERAPQARKRFPASKGLFVTCCDI